MRRSGGRYRPRPWPTHRSRPALESKRPVPRPALGYALVWSAVVLWSLNAVIAKVVLDSAGLSPLRLVQVARPAPR